MTQNKPTEAEIIKYAYSDEHMTKTAPVQGYEPGIPWALHLEAYEAYRKKWNKQTALIDLDGRNCRGGFTINELDQFIPGWKNRVSYIGRLETKVKDLEQEKKKLLTSLRVAYQVMKETPFKPVSSDDIPFSEIELWNNTLTMLRDVITEHGKTLIQELKLEENTSVVT